MTAVGSVGGGTEGAGERHRAPQARWLRAEPGQETQGGYRGRILAVALTYTIVWPQAGLF